MNIIISLWHWLFLLHISFTYISNNNCNKGKWSFFNAMNVPTTTVHADLVHELSVFCSLVPETIWMKKVHQIAASQCVGQRYSISIQETRLPDTQLVTQWACQLVFSFFLMLMRFEDPVQFSLIVGISSLSCGSGPVLFPPSLLYF